MSSYTNNLLAGTSYYYQASLRLPAGRQGRSAESDRDDSPVRYSTPKEWVLVPPTTGYTRWTALNSPIQHSRS